MAILEIPIDSTVPHQQFRIELDGDSFTLEVRWNGRDGGWFLSVYDADAEPIVLGVKVVINWPLLGRVVDERAPAGQFMAYDTEESGRDAGEGELGARVKLLYAEASV